ncbi:MAG TPA: BofC C-terminal domain-containing protein [Paenibacillus sp.]
MNIFRTKKQWKRRWKRWRRAIWTFSACALVAAMAWMGLQLSGQLEKLMTGKPLALETLGKIRSYTEEQSGQPSADWLKGLQDRKRARIVHLNKIYTCGEERSVLGIMDAEDIETLAKEHPKWTGRVDSLGEVWLEEHILGLSEECQRSGYMGIDKDGNLSLFEGPPKEEKVLRTFFQLDVETMESVLPEDVVRQLQQGIRVQDVDEYNSVLSTFSDFAVEVSQEALKQHK